MKTILLAGLLSLMISTSAFATANVQYGSIITTSTTTNQVVLSYTPSSTATLKTITIGDYQTPGMSSLTSAPLSVVTIQLNGSTIFQQVIYPALYGTTTGATHTPAGLIVIPLGDGLTFTGSQTLKILVSPQSSTSQTINGSLFFN
jgi:hypothetical protein